MRKFLIAIFCLLISSTSSSALVEVDITRGNLDPLPIAVSPLYVEPGSKSIKQGFWGEGLSRGAVHSFHVPSRIDPISDSTSKYNKGLIKTCIKIIGVM